VVELAYTADLKSAAPQEHEGSNPSARTRSIISEEWLNGKAAGC
jgi:hypothetical protein